MVLEEERSVMLHVRTRSLVVLTLVSLLSGLIAAPAVAAPTGGGKPSTSKAILFASDGMRPDLMEKYAAEGQMPTYAALMASGVKGVNGMVQAFPPNTGVGWYTIATGTYPSEHGSTNNTFFRTGDAFTARTSFSGAGVLQADTIANAAERAGKKVAQIDWVGGRSANIEGPTVDFANFFSTRGVLAAPLNADEQAGAASFGISYQIASFADASGWTNVSAGDPAAPAKQSVLTVATSFAAQNPTRTYDVYVYDSVVDGTVGYDTVVLVKTGSKDGSQAAASLGQGDWTEVKLTGADGLIGARAGQTAGFYTKLITLAPDLSSFKLYFTSVERVIASCGSACSGLPAGGAGEDRLEKYLAENVPTYVASDFAPLEARIIDEDTYVEQGRDLEAAYSNAVLDYILGTLQPNTDLAMVGYPVTDEFSHQFMALTVPTDMDGNANPYYDDVNGDGTKDNRLAIREGYIRSAYHEADAKLARTRGFMGPNATVFAGSDHGFAPQWLAVNANKVLNDATVSTVNGPVSLHASNASSSNCSATTSDLTKACWAGGAIQVYVNAGATFDAVARPNAPTYAQVRAAITAAFQNLTDPARPGSQVVLKILQKEELRNVDGSDSLHPNRSGDVVVVLRPPYQADAATTGVAIAFSQFFGQHGYLPELVDLAHSVNMHATFVASGPGIRKQAPVAGIRAIDVAPTLAFLLGIDGPQNARGKILVNLTTKPSLKVYSILDISDYHGQLVPLLEAADSLGPSFSIGGAAFLKPWFDVYRAEAQNGSITVAAGDSVGATPPISNFFGDKPTIEIMNLMGFNADGLGNHNFDRKSAYLRNELIPLAQYPFLSSNVVDANGRTPAQWKPSAVFSLDGAKVGLVGFTNEDAPTLVSPDAFDPFHVEPRLPRVQAEIAKLRAAGVKTVVVMGHDGATAGTLTNPTGPLLDLADALTGADVLIGDHTDFQVLSRRSNGLLVTENRSKGIRFTRIRLVVDPSTKAAVYTTADFHKPWDIGVTPDPTIQGRIDDLNAQLAPIFNQLVGKSTVEVPRGDACRAATGRTDGRACESLVGDLVTDALRWSYGTDFVLTNSGGLRADLTCPIAVSDPNSQDFCPPAVYPVPDGSGQYSITRGQVLGVLPFGNVSATLTINGAELKDYLETAVSSLPATGNGRFGQVSGLCFTFDVQATPISFDSRPRAIPGTGSRVVSAVRQAADGSCTGAPIDFSSGVTYSFATNDFTAGGGDGYQDFRARMTTQDILDQDLADYLAAQPGNLISPAIQGRIHCTDSNPALAPACPVGSP
jgi:2',3'-cyclic-nucleotide 2'-phosphodiesterase (5'-nucleotidase family)/predicted AlkP superfamily phosphohydrolase/phosphomutase